MTMRLEMYLICFVIAVIAPGCGQTPTPPRKIETLKDASESAPNSGEPLVADDFEIRVPIEWKPATPDQKKTKVMLLLGGEYWMTAEGMLKVDVGKPVKASARATAEEFATKSNATISSDVVLLDGETGIKVTTDSETMQTPRVLIAVLRNGRIYLIMAAGKDHDKIDAAITTVCESWKWKQ